jgi:hypothetical protein
MQYVAGLADDVEGSFGSQVVVMPSGRVAATLEVDRHGNDGYRHLSFAPYSGGWLTQFDNEGLAATLLGPDGALRRSLGFGPGHVFSRRGRDEIVFVFVPPHRLLRWDVATLGPTGLRRLGPARSTAGFLGAHEVVVTTRDGVYRVDVRTRSRTLVPGVSAASMVSSRSGRLIGTSDGEHGVFDARTGQPMLASPSYRLRGFNPSGDLVVGYRHARGPYWELVLADVDTGKVLQAFRWRSYGPPEAVVWEDDRTVLVDFVRFQLDGKVELARVLRSAPQYGPYLLPPPIS